MPKPARTHRLVRATGDEAVLRTTRAIAVQELCASLVMSKAMTRRMLATQQLRIAGLAGTPNIQTVIPAESEVSLALRVTRTPIVPSATPARILWQDRFILAVEKPAGLIVHGDGGGDETLTSRAQASVNDMWSQKGWGRPPVPQALQRLDKETTGIVLFSLTEELQPLFDALIAGHDLHKRYVAAVRGDWPWERRTIAEPIGRDRHDARRMRVSATGKHAVTEVMCLERRDGLSLLGVELRTGRRHQIRVHLSHEGHPIAGDGLYGGGRGPLMLHALEQSFVHPITGEPLCLRTAWPDRFTKLFSPCAPDWSILDTEVCRRGAAGRH